ncbi:MAG: hypothetical protein KKA90_02455 [Nanoarchaeota archaeon]|nr:hypothetical protein [Nanoarchaeota archaeon]
MYKLAFLLILVLVVAGCTTEPQPSLSQEELVVQQFESLVAEEFRPARPIFSVEQDAEVCLGQCDQYKTTWDINVTSGPYTGTRMQGDVTLFFFNETLIPGLAWFLLSGNVTLVDDGTHPFVEDVFQFHGTAFNLFKDEPEFQLPLYYGETDDRCLYVRVSTIKQCPEDACMDISDTYTYCDNSQCWGTFSINGKLSITNDIKVICGVDKEEAIASA